MVVTSSAIDWSDKLYINIGHPSYLPNKIIECYYRSTDVKGRI